MCLLDLVFEYFGQRHDGLTVFEMIPQGRQSFITGDDVVVGDPLDQLKQDIALLGNRKAVEVMDVRQRPEQFLADKLVDKFFILFNADALVVDVGQRFVAG